MNVKQYQAASMYEAVQKIKRELGSDAVILHAKQVRQRRFGLFPTGATWEVTAAVDHDAGRPTPPRSTALAQPKQPLSATPPTSDWREIVSTLAELQWEVRKLSRQGQLTRVASFSPNLRSLYLRLREQEVDDDLACEIVSEINDQLSPQAVSNYELVAESASRKLQQVIRCSGPLRLSHNQPQTVFVIGPTGVGKTTTIAKLAANFALIDRRSVLLVTIDTYRIAALPQLKTYAEIMGVPMAVAYTVAELRNVVEENQDKELILIDTPGRGQRNERQIGELKACVDAISNKRVYLAISAATRYRELVDVVDRFGVIEFDSLVVTKLDEAVVYGPILNLLAKVKKPLSYVTTGQCVPEDIEEASPSRMADLLLGRDTCYASGSSCGLKKTG